MSFEHLNDESIIDLICKNLANTSLDCKEEEEKSIDEFSLLESSLKLKSIGISILKKTIERYERYLSEIDVWEVDDLSCYYIKDYIIKFLKDKTLSFVDKVSLMRYIDNEIFMVVNKIKK